MLSLRKGIVILVLVYAAASAGGQKYDLDIGLREKRIDAPSLEGLTFVFVLTLANTSNSPQSLVRYDYRVAIDQVEFLKLETVLPFASFAGEPLLHWNI